MTQVQHTTTTPIVALPEGKECQSYKNTPLHDTGTVGFVLLVFFFLALFFRGGYKYITDIANHLFSIRKRQNAFEIHTASETFLMLAMIANTCIMSGLIFYLGIDYWYPEIGLSQNVFKWVSILSVFYGLFFLVQLLLYRTIGFTFAYNRDDIRLWLDGFKSSQAILGLVLSPIVFISLLYPASTLFMLILAIISYFCARIIFIIKGFRIFFNNFGSYIYFILYLCTLEIVPIFLICAGAINLCENI